MQQPRKSLMAIAVSVTAMFLSACGGGSTNSGGGVTTAPKVSNEWTWMRGADDDAPTPPGWVNPWAEPYNSDPYYGTLGVAGLHTVPGGRNSSAYWTDSSGNFWLFGGDGLAGSSGTGASSGPIHGLLNDLWEYSPATSEWTWRGGSSDLSSVCATAGGGDCGPVGVYGTLGVPGPANVPGGRECAVSWTDKQGNLWLFGGRGIDATGKLGYLNDLWKFNPSSQQWTWISGSQTEPVSSAGPGALGVYGTQGVANAANVPPGLQKATGWIDQSGNLWLFGGFGLTADAGTAHLFNNLWMFNISTLEWTWVAGAGGGDSPNPGVYGTLGTAAVGNTPSGRDGATGWTDANGNFWLFGGYGVYTATNPPTENDLNELWEFSPASAKWTWVGGTQGGVPNAYGNLGPPPASYGTLGVAATSNIPGGRQFAMGWTDSEGNLWLFGGEGVDSTGMLGWGSLNDLWKYNLGSKQWTWVSGTNLSYAAGVYGTEGTPAAGNMPGSRYLSAVWMDTSGNLWVFAGWGNITRAIGGGTALNDLWRYQP